MDKTLLVKWLAGIVARGVSWILLAWLGYQATTADQTTILSACEAAGAVVVLIVTVYSSVKGRSRLLLTTPPPASEVPLAPAKP